MAKQKTIAEQQQEVMREFNAASQALNQKFDPLTQPFGKKKQQKELTESQELRELEDMLEFRDKGYEFVADTKLRQVNNGNPQNPSTQPQVTLYTAVTSTLSYAASFLPSWR